MFTEITLLFESLIVVFFWTVLFPLIDKDAIGMYKYVFNYIDHITPAVFIYVDMLLNRVPLSPRHLAVILPLMLVYGMQYVVVSLLRDKPIYPVLDPKKPIGYLIAAGLLVVVSIWYMLYVWIIKWRDGKYREIDRENHWAVATSAREQSNSIAQHKMFCVQVAVDKFEEEAKVISTSLKPDEKLEAMIMSVSKLFKNLDNTFN